MHRSWPLVAVVVPALCRADILPLTGFQTTSGSVAAYHQGVGQLQLQSYALSSNTPLESWAPAPQSIQVNTGSTHGTIESSFLSTIDGGRVSLEARVHTSSGGLPFGAAYTDVQFTQRFDLRFQVTTAGQYLLSAQITREFTGYGYFNDGQRISFEREGQPPGYFSLVPPGLGPSAYGPLVVTLAPGTYVLMATDVGGFVASIPSTYDGELRVSIVAVPAPAGVLLLAAALARTRRRRAAAPAAP